jgi:rhodanese-related sulfurtransferase
MGLFGRLFSQPYRNVSIVQARALLDDGAVLVDVRTNQEWNAGHAPVARHLSLESLGRGASGLRQERVVVTICRTGARSTQAARMLASKGYTVASVRGGMYAWQRSGGPVVAKNGRKGEVV